MRDELLALLEDGPHRAAELCLWLEQPRIVVAHALKALAAEGLVKQTGLTKHWALATFSATVGRPATVDRAAARTAILQALAMGPRATEQLTAATGCSRNVVRQECTRLMTSGDVQHDGAGRAATWARAGTPRLLAASTSDPAVDPEDRLRTLTTETIVLMVTTRGPMRIIPLARLLNVNHWTLRDRLADLETRGVIELHRGVGRGLRVMLPTQAEAIGRRAGDRDRATQPRQAFRDRAAVPEPTPAGDSVCEGCGTRFLRRVGTSGRFCSRTCYETPPRSDVRTIVVDGQTYDATSVGAHPLTVWPDDERHGGSSLSGCEFGVKR